MGRDTTIGSGRVTAWRRAVIVGACAVLSAASLVARSSAAHAVASPVTVSYTAVGEHTFVVPAGVSILHVVAVGGRGFGPNGYGALVTSDLAVAPGQTLYAEVGGPGQGPTAGIVVAGTMFWVGGAGGANGGAAGGTGFSPVSPIPVGGGGGGGASDLRACATTATTCDSPASRLVVAGGGAGFGGEFAGGNGGTPDGDDGQNDGTASPGHGGTQHAGGAPGFVSQPDDSSFGFGGSPGAFGNGGAGANGIDGGGGGGGGWFGGGGGAATSIFSTKAAGGGGGSSSGPAGTTYAVGHDAGGALPASVTISYAPRGPLDHLTVAPASPSIVAGGSQDFTAEGFDAHDTDLGDVTGDTTFAITPDGSCTAKTCTATTAGPHTISATDGTATGTAALTVTAGPARSVAATGGTPQFATIGTAFTNVFAATVTDAYGNPVPGVDVTFTAPDAGASGTWNNGSTAVATTGTDGVATAPTFTADHTLGRYTITATAARVTADASFDLENTAASFPYTSQYTSDEARWLYTDALYLHDFDTAHIQHTGAVFVAFLGGLVERQHTDAPDLGVDPGSGPVAVTSSYTPDENSTVQHAATTFSTDVPSLQRAGVRLIAFLVTVSR